MVQQVLGEARDKKEFESPGSRSVSPNLGTTMAQGVPPSTDGLGGKGAIANQNLPQTYYQTHAYGPSTQEVPDAYFQRPPVMPTAAGGPYGGMSENVRDQVARTLREFGLEPKGRTRTY
jgi:hypothetical protein